MPKKAKSYSFLNSKVLLFQHNTKTGFARWSYRITLPSGEKIERVLCDHFAYNNHHFQSTGERCPIGTPPSDKIVEYATRVYNAYKEEYGRTGRVTIGLPSLVDIIADHCETEDDFALLDKHIPDREGARGRRRGEVMFLELDRVIKTELDQWLAQFGKEEANARYALRRALANAYGAGSLNLIPAILG